MVEYLKKSIKNKIIEDIIVIGFSDKENDVIRFFPNYKSLYFKFAAIYVRFESIAQFSKLKVSVLDSIKFDYEVDEDMDKAFMSISEIVLDDSMACGNEIANITFYNLDNASSIVCDAINIKLANGQEVFLDPSFYFGINVGGRRQKELWRSNIRDNMVVAEETIKIVDV